MPQNVPSEFNLDFDEVDYDYDPLADTDADVSEEDDPGDFTGTPIASLIKSDTAAPEPAAPACEQSARERIEALFEKFNPRRRVLEGILRFLDTPQSATALDAKVTELQTHDFSVYTATNYAALLEAAGAITKTDENGILFSEAPEQQPLIVEVDGVAFLKPAPWREVYWCATDDAREFLASNNPMERLKELLDRDAVYLSIYLRILDAASRDEGAKTPELNAIVDDDPLVQQPRLYTAHFTELLERCGALRWEGIWRTTEVGLTFLNGQDDTTATDAESEA